MAQLTDDCFAFGGPLLSVEEAAALIAERVPVLAGIETVSLVEADGRIAAGGVLAGLDLRWAAGQWSDDRKARNPYNVRIDPRDVMARGSIPWVGALHGATLGGGFENACAMHVRVGDETTYFGLPEGTRGIFIGGGGSVRVPKLIGAARMTDMMLTGRVYNAQDGERAGFAQYLVPAGTALDKAMSLAGQIATNAPLTNHALIHALPRIAEQPADHGYLTESLISSITQSAPEAKARVEAFLQGRASKTKPPSE